MEIIGFFIMYFSTGITYIIAFVILLGWNFTMFAIVKDINFYSASAPCPCGSRSKNRATAVPVFFTWNCSKYNCTNCCDSVPKLFGVVLCMVLYEVLHVLHVKVKTFYMYNNYTFNPQVYKRNREMSWWCTFSACVRKHFWAFFSLTANWSSMKHSRDDE